MIADSGCRTLLQNSESSNDRPAPAKTLDPDWKVHVSALVCAPQRCSAHAGSLYFKKLESLFDSYQKCETARAGYSAATPQATDINSVLNSLDAFLKMAMPAAPPDALSSKQRLILLRIFLRTSPSCLLPTKWRANLASTQRGVDRVINSPSNQSMSCHFSPTSSGHRRPRQTATVASHAR
jgi:hypothetical protein